MMILDFYDIILVIKSNMWIVCKVFTLFIKKGESNKRKEKSLFDNVPFLGVYFFLF